MQDLINEVSSLSKSLDIALREFRKRGEELADAERNYRVALSTKILKERDGGIQVSIISDVCRGSREIADLKFKRDVAQVLFDSSREALMVYKLKIKVYENQIDREWNSGGRG
jgi:DNA polymerase II small subunit/DNA polymerase delta subunit B